MYTLTVDETLAYVRKALDELISAEEIGLLVEPDALNLRKIVEGSIIEAVVTAYYKAPASLMEGVIGVKDEDYQLGLLNGVATITFLVPIARLLSLRCFDSEIIMTSMVMEDSAEGRKQLNKYIRGTHDEPSLVLQKVWEADHQPRMRYYSTTEDDQDDLDFDIEYLPYPSIKDGSVEIAPRLKFAILNLIVSMVLDSYKETALAEQYRAKAKEHMEI